MVALSATSRLFDQGILAKSLRPWLNLEWYLRDFETKELTSAMAHGTVALVGMASLDSHTKYYNIINN